jgi:DNA-binding FadR family transcriptional regulator
MADFLLNEATAQPRTRAEIAAERVREIGQRQPAGSRLGSRSDLREICGVSVGTFNEALRILQSTGEITVRPGPGGGVFAAERSAFARLSRQVQDLTRIQPDLNQVTRIVRALDPMIVADATLGIDDAGRIELRTRLERLESSVRGQLRDVLLSSFEVYATIVSLGPDALLRAFLGTLLKALVLAVQSVPGPVAPQWTDMVDRHIAGVGALVEAILTGDVDAARAARQSHDLVELFDAALAHSS